MSFATLGRTVKPHRTKRSRQQRRAFFIETLEERLPLSVNFTDLDDDSIADNDSLATAQEIIHPGLTSGVVDSWTPGAGTLANVTDGDGDWYKTSASVVGDLWFAVLNLGGDPGNGGGADGTGDDDLSVSVFNNSDVRIAGPTLLVNGDRFFFSTPAANVTDVFKIVVEGDNATQDANYQLRVLNVDSEDVVGNNTRGSATDLGDFSGTPVNTDNFPNPRPDRASSQFKSNGVNGLVEVVLTMPPGTGLATPGTATNLGVRIRDDSGVILATSNGTTTAEDLATFEAINGDTYFIEVYSGTFGQLNRSNLEIRHTSLLTCYVTSVLYTSFTADGFPASG
mgnify:CR=1 FL=1